MKSENGICSFIILVFYYARHSKNFESFLLKREMIVLTKENKRIHILNIFLKSHWKKLSDEEGIPFENNDFFLQMPKF